MPPLGLFGLDARILLHAATHRHEIARVDGWTVVNPGSAVLPAEGAQRSFAMLTVGDRTVTAEIVTPYGPASHRRAKPCMTAP